MKNFLSKYGMLINSMVFMAALTACKPELKDTDVERAVRHYYSEISTQAGGGTHEVEQVSILEKFKTMHNDTMNLILAVSGMYENGSIAGEAGEPRAFRDTFPFEIHLNKAGEWEGYRRDDFVSPLEN